LENRLIHHPITIASKQKQSAGLVKDIMGRLPSTERRRKSKLLSVNENSRRAHTLPVARKYGYRFACAHKGVKAP
jgi:hypothetical protein